MEKRSWRWSSSSSSSLSQSRGVALVPEGVRASHAGTGNVSCRARTTGENLNTSSVWWWRRLWGWWQCWKEGNCKKTGSPFSSTIHNKKKRKNEPESQCQAKEKGFTTFGIEFRKKWVPYRSWPESVPNKTMPMSITKRKTKHFPVNSNATGCTLW